MDASLSEATGILPVALPQQGPCIPDSGRIDVVDVGKLKQLQVAQEARDKTRCYWFVFWPESVNASKLFSIFRSSGLAIAVSPLHDRDVRDSDTGELSKPHYHVLVRFPSPRYLEPVRRLVGSWMFDADALTSSDAAGVAVEWYVRPVSDYAGALRYLCHLDNPDKHQYAVNEVMTFGYIDVSMLYAKSVADDVESYYELISWCRQNPGRSYADLLDVVYDSGDRSLMRVLTRYSYTLKGYLTERGRGKKQPG